MIAQQVVKMLVFYVANPGLIPSIPHVPKAYQEQFLSAELGVTQWGVAPKNKQTNKQRKSLASNFGICKENTNHIST